MKRGFTLIEIVLYLALYSILIGGVMVALYTLIESQHRNTSYALLEEEGNFITTKITWILSTTNSIQLPVNTGNILSVTATDGSHIQVYLQSGNIVFATNSNPYILNSDVISIHDLLIIYSVFTSADESIDDIHIQFVANATTSDGHIISRAFFAHSLVQ